MADDCVTLPRDINQARALGQFALDFLAGHWGQIDPRVVQRLELFHVDSIGCAVSAIAAGANAPCVLRHEALEYPSPATRGGVPLLGSSTCVQPEKAVAANASAAREWDANGTNFGYNPLRGHTAGEFGHNDFYPVAVAAAQCAGYDGRQTLRAMLLLDEIRGRLAEVFSLKEHKIDHVVHGGIASAVVFAAVLGATAQQIESAIGMLVAHYVPFRAIRAGKQLSDSKGASAALTAEAAVLCARRAMRGFVGPADVFRNPEAIFCRFVPPPRPDCSPFDLVLSTSGSDFAVMGMHFKLGLYEHQSAGAIEGLIRVLSAHPQLLDDPQQLQRIRVIIYQPAYGIICDPAKRDPQTRQSADHSLPYIVATLLRKAFATRRASWSDLMLLPEDYDDAALRHPETRAWMQRIELVHGGEEYDRRYPEGIPTTIELHHARLGNCSSGLVMFPAGHARNTEADVESLLREKFMRLASSAVDDPAALWDRFHNTQHKSADQIRRWFDFQMHAP
jgi:2-methylcitrate dehydratase